MARLAAPHTKNRQEGPIGYHRAGIANLQFSHSLEELINRLFAPNERTGVNAVHLAVRAIQLHIIDPEHLVADDE